MGETSYADWARAFHGHAFARRSAERNAAFLLPHLEPGQRLLDVGCGPGTITAGLAARVAPGEAVGIDLEAEHLATARAGVSGVRFEEADAASLPFEDAAFDVAFLHAVLQHVESPAAVLAEIRRVLRPGGLVAVGDLDMAAVIVHPPDDRLLASFALDRRTRRNPDVGRRLSELLVGAGFGAVELSVVANVVTGPGPAAAAAASTTRRLDAAPFRAHAVAEGWATDGDLTAMVAAWQAWSEAPGAVLVTHWFEGLAR